REAWSKMLEARGFSKQPIRSFVLLQRYKKGKTNVTFAEDDTKGWWIYRAHGGGELTSSLEVIDLQSANAATVLLGKNAPRISRPAPMSRSEDFRAEVLAIANPSSSLFHFVPTKYTCLNDKECELTLSWEDRALTYRLDPKTWLPTAYELDLPRPPSRFRRSNAENGPIRISGAFNGFVGKNGILQPREVTTRGISYEVEFYANQTLSEELFQVPIPERVQSPDAWRVQQHP
ncbi:hypothetical protein AB4043_21545, partial [Terriglobus sp. YAF25]